MVTWVTQKRWCAENFHTKRSSSHIRFIRLTVTEGRRERRSCHLFSHGSPHCFSPRKLVPNTSSKAAHFLAHDFLSTLAHKPIPWTVHLEWVYLVDPAFSLQEGSGPEHTPLRKGLPTSVTTLYWTCPPLIWVNYSESIFVYARDLSTTFGKWNAKNFTVMVR